MTNALTPTTCSIKISIGPEIEQASSWNWVGEDLIETLQESQIYLANSFQDELPQCDLYVFVKWLPELHDLRALFKRSSVIDCPIDVYCKLLSRNFSRSRIMDRWQTIISEVFSERGDR